MLICAAQVKLLAAKLKDWVSCHILTWDYYNVISFQYDFRDQPHSGISVLINMLMFFTVTVNVSVQWHMKNEFKNVNWQSEVVTTWYNISLSQCWILFLAICCFYNHLHSKSSIIYPERLNAHKVFIILWPERVWMTAWVINNATHVISTCLWCKCQWLQCVTSAAVRNISSVICRMVQAVTPRPTPGKM